jgi:hypothetical protein
MSDKNARDAGFCVVDANADPIASTLVRRLRNDAADMESEVNRLYRGRNAFELSDLALADMERTIGRLRYMAETLREVEQAQRRVAYLQAAE